MSNERFTNYHQLSTAPAGESMLEAQAEAGSTRTSYLVEDRSRGSRVVKRPSSRTCGQRTRTIMLDCSCDVESHLISEWSQGLGIMPVFQVVAFLKHSMHSLPIINTISERRSITCK